MNSNRIFYGTILWALLMFFVIHFLHFPGSLPDFREASGGGALFDNAIAYTPQEVYQRLDAFGERGRDNYLFRNLTVDMLLPLSLFPFLYLWMRRSTQNLGSVSLRHGFLALPWIYLIFDIIENLIVVALIRQFPMEMPSLASVLPYVTLLKRLGVFSSLIIALTRLSF